MSQETSAGRTRKRTVLILGALCAVVWAGFLSYTFLADARSTASVEPGPKPVEMEVHYSTDVSDPRNLVAVCDAIFVGKVIEEVSNVPAPSSDPNAEDIDGHPRTQYAVTVEQVIAGDLKAGSRQTVSQDGGRGRKTGKLYRVTGVVAAGGEQAGGRSTQAADAPLEPGNRYIFSTLTEPETGYRGIVGEPWGDRPLGNPNEQRAIDEFRRAAQGGS